MHECYTMQILEKQRNKNKKMVTKSKVIKHKKHVRQTQLD